MKKLLTRLISAAAAVCAAALLCVAVYAGKNAADVTSFTVSFIDENIAKSRFVNYLLPENEEGEQESKAYYNIYDKNNLSLTVKYSDGSSETVSGNGITALEARLGCKLEMHSDNNEKWEYGSHTVDFSFAGKSAKAKCKVKSSPISAIKVEPLYPIRPVYHLDGKFCAVSDSKGNISEKFVYDLGKYDYNISVSFSGSVTLTYPSYLFEEKTGFAVEFVQEDGELSAGKHKAYCIIDGVKGEFDFEIVKNNIKSVQLYFSEKDYSISYPNDFYTTKNNLGNTVEMPLYDRSKIMAKVTYSDGSTKSMKIGELCASTHSELIIDDSAVAIGRTAELPAEIKGIKTTLTLTVNADSLPAVTALTIQKIDKSLTLGWSDNSNADYYIVEKYNGSQWSTLGVTASKSYTVTSASDIASDAFRIRSAAHTENGLITSSPTEISNSDAVGNISGFAVLQTENGGAYLSWNENTLCSGYIIEQYKDKKWVRISKVTNNATASYTLSSSVLGDSTQFRICGYRSANGVQTNGEYAYADLTKRPDAPSKLSVIDTAADSVLLRWTACEKVDGYIVEMKKNDNWSSVIKITNRSVTEYKKADLSGATDYTFRIKSYITVKDAVIYSDGTEVTVCTLPSAVKDIKLAGRAADALRISWSEEPAADGYIVEMYDGTKWTRISKTDSAGITEHRQAGLGPGTVYKFRVKAYKGSVSGAYGSTLSVRTNPSVTKGIKLAGRASSALRISWAKNDSADGYIIEMLRDGKWTRTAKITSNTVTEYRQTGLAAGTAYSFRVRAYKMSGKTALYGKYANISARTYPSGITGLKVLGRAKSAIRIGWAKNNSADGYIIEMYKDGKWVRIGKITDNSVVQFRESGLYSGTTYKFRVKSYKMSGKTALYSGYVTISGKTT